ncbi:HIT family protein [Marinobacter salicampi]|uniref:HIT family protein n=1 Tax=Marinobacter salicampi TaxID=435907 RepID=UPI00140B14DE|nr:HIT family protein [Marinobacter salicampi]
MSCIFCQIVAGELPASIAHEDELCIAFMDIHPLGRGHVLVVPREHGVQCTEVSAELMAHIFRVARRILVAQRQLGWGLPGTHILLNDGAAANQTVPHIHVHVIPREKGDTLRSVARLTLHVTRIFGQAAPRVELERQARSLRDCMMAMMADSDSTAVTDRD